MVSLPFESQLRTLVSGLVDRIAHVTGLRRLYDRAAMRLEDEHHDDHYDVHAQIPGVEPASDVAVTVADGVLTITAERAGGARTLAHSEFCYGSFTRSVPLPEGAKPDDLTTRYDKGILTVSVPVSSPAADESADETSAAPVDQSAALVE